MKSAIFLGSLATVVSLTVVHPAEAQYSPTQLAQPAVKGEQQNQANIENQGDPRFKARYGAVSRPAPAPTATPVAPNAAPVAAPGVAPAQPVAVVPAQPPQPQRDARFTARYGSIVRAAQPTAPTPAAPVAVAPAVVPGTPVAAIPVAAPQKRDDPEREQRIINFQRQNAISGNPSAQYDLGMRYLKGDGLEQDNKLALQWLKMSAENGNSRARKQLAELAASPASAKPAPAAPAGSSPKPEAAAK